MTDKELEYRAPQSVVDRCVTIDFPFIDHSDPMVALFFEETKRVKVKLLVKIPLKLHKEIETDGPSVVNEIGYRSFLRTYIMDFLCVGNLLKTVHIPFLTKHIKTVSLCRKNYSTWLDEYTPDQSTLSLEVVKEYTIDPVSEYPAIDFGYLDLHRWCFECKHFCLSIETATIPLTQCKYAVEEVYELDMDTINELTELYPREENR